MSEGEAQMLEGGLIEDQHAILRRIRPGYRFDVPRAAAAQRIVQRGRVGGVSERELDCMQHGGIRTPTLPKGYFFS